MNWAKAVAIFSAIVVAAILLIVFGLAGAAFLYPEKVSAPRTTALATGLMAFALLLSYISQFTGVTVADFFRKPRDHPVLTAELAMTSGGSMGMVAFVGKIKNLGSAFAKNIRGGLTQEPADPNILAGSSFNLAGLPPDPLKVGTFFLVEPIDFPGLALDTRLTLQVTYEDYHDRSYSTSVSATLRDLEEVFRREGVRR